MTDAIDRSKPPEGYVECPKKCGRWMAMKEFAACWTCVGARNPPCGDTADWTPPVPAPAVERRAGQRWRMECTDGRVIEGTLAMAEETWWPLRDVITNDGLGATGRCFGFRAWDGSMKTMTLLSEAPATSEPGRTVTGHVCGNGCAVCDPPATPPAQEAAKAEPKCVKCGRCHGGRCGPYPIQPEKENARAYLDWAATQLGASYLHDDKHPERLPPPRLTHSSMWADFAEDTK